MHVPLYLRWSSFICNLVKSHDLLAEDNAWLHERLQYSIEERCRLLKQVTILESRIDEISPDPTKEDTRIILHQEHA